MALVTLPNLHNCLSSNKDLRPKETKGKNQRITNQQVLKNPNKCNGSTVNGTRKETYLPLNYDDNIITKQMLNTKIMPNILKQHKLNHESHLVKSITGRWKTHKMRDFSLTQQSCKQKTKLCIHPKTHIENIKARITRAFQGCNVVG